MPQNGYTEMIKNLLDHPNISVLLNTDYKDIQDRISFDRMYYSGAIDEYHSYRYGKLPYRCVFFNLRHLPAKSINLWRSSIIPIIITIQELRSLNTFITKK